MLKNWVLLLSMLVMSLSMYAQKQLINGVVKDNLGDPVPGVNVTIKGTMLGVITDFDGKYSIECPDENSILVFSFIGLATQEIAPGKEHIINVILKPEDVGIDEVVVVGYGVQKKESAIASISQAKGEELMKAGSVTTVSQAMQGMLPGVTAMVDNGKPGADAAEILIRGKASWQSSSPLILVDGIERDMNDIDPNEIETLSVLKDASATAVFGVKGANGVILITTKRGTVSKPEISFSANFGIKQPTANPKFSDYVTAMEMWNEALRNDNDWEHQIPESTINAWKEAYASGNYGSYNEEFPEINWWDEMVNDYGYQKNFNINVRGGTEYLKYFVSLGYLNDGDIFKTHKTELFDPSFKYERYNWRSNFDFSLTKTTDLAVNISGKLGYRNQAGYRLDGNGEDGWGQEQFFKGIYTASQNSFPIKYSDGNWGVSAGGDGNLMLQFDKGQRIYKYYQGFIDLKLKQKLDFLLKGLKASVAVSYNAQSSYGSRVQRYSGGNFGPDAVAYYREYDYANPNPDGSYPVKEETRRPSEDFQSPPPSASYDYLLNDGFNKHLYYEVALNYAHSFGDHNVSALALFSRRESEGLKNNSSSEFAIPHRQEDWVGRVTYNWKERYLTEINGAYNGSENFAPGKRFGFFPSLTVGWRISEEPVVKGFAGNFLTNMKLKYSYGMAGMDNGANRFGYQQSYDSGNNVSFGTTTSNKYGPIYTEGAAANENATWEESIKQNAGVEFTLWCKLNGSVDLYKEKRQNILMDLWSPIWYVQKEAKANIGETKNHGAEFELGWNDEVGNNFKYWMKGNFAVNENRVVKRGDGVNTEDYKKQAGKPIGYQKRYIVYDYYSDLDDIYNYATPGNTGNQGKLVPGDFMYVDYNADGVIDGEGDKVVTKDLTYPLTTYGFSLGCQYKGWSLNMVFYGVSNVSKEVDGLLLWDNWDGLTGIYKANDDVTERWTPENADNAGKPVLHSPNVGYSHSPSTYTFQNASYLRLKTAELSYSFNKKLLSVIKLKKLELYGNGNNLVTFTKLDKRMDPETKAAGVYPVVKRYNFGIRATF